MKTVFFASSNPDKFDEVRRILGRSDALIEFARLDLMEIQADDLEPIAAAKAREACKRLDAPAFVEDAGLFVESLHGFPGPYSAYVFRTLGIEGILDLLHGKQDREARFRSVIGYCEPGGAPECFTASVDGAIAARPRGGGWGYDPIFAPNGAGGLTYGELEGQKNDWSHRRKSLDLFVGYLGARV